ncbi:MAG: ribbon-helix-helix protein, CopG family [Clostridia bacterium]
MSDKFVVRPKRADRKEDKTVIMTLRMDRELQEEFDRLSARSDRSRNELMCMALRYALDHLEFIPDDEAEKESC